MDGKVVVIKHGNELGLLHLYHFAWLDFCARLKLRVRLTPLQFYYFVLDGLYLGYTRGMIISQLRSLGNGPLILFGQKGRAAWLLLKRRLQIKLSGLAKGLTHHFLDGLFLLQVFYHHLCRRLQRVRTLLTE
jgi:hypothetical protein